MKDEKYAALLARWLLGDEDVVQLQSVGNGLLDVWGPGEAAEYVGRIYWKEQIAQLLEYRMLGGPPITLAHSLTLADTARLVTEPPPRIRKC